MRATIFFLVFSIVLTTACTRAELKATSAIPDDTSKLKTPRTIQPIPKNANVEYSLLFRPHYEIQDLQRLQGVVDAGHQPWRLEPVDVALSFLSENKIMIGSSVVPIKTMIGTDRAVIEIPGNVNYRVTLGKFKDGNGIWFVETVERQEQD